MIAARWAMLVLSTVVMLAAFGVRSAQWPPSALRLLVTTVVGLLAPLFWPGSAATPARTAARIVGWSAAAAALAAVAMRIAGDPAQPFARIFVACALLMALLLVAHALAAALDAHWRRHAVDATGAREMSGRAVSLALALLGSLPLWLGPAAELLASRRAWIVDVVIGISPLTHLAVASNNDLLRNQWLYQHCNLAAVRFSYPELAELAGCYASLGAALALIALALRRLRRPHVALK